MARRSQRKRTARTLHNEGAGTSNTGARGKKQKTVGPRSQTLKAIENGSVASGDRPIPNTQPKEGQAGSKTGRPLRLYADGIFDLFHFGHAKALQQCKEAYPNVILLVGCCSDELTHSLKGKTVMTDKERYESLRHCRWVDEVVEDAPWVITDEFMDKHKIDFVCHDALPYGDASGESDEGDVYARLKKMGRFHETQRTEGISTTDLIVRIVSQYDRFIRRNLARGYTGKEMNVPFMKEQSIKIGMAVDKMRDKTKEIIGESEQLINKWGCLADDLQYQFLQMFQRDGPLRTKFRAQRQAFKNRIEHLSKESFC